MNILEKIFTYKKEELEHQKRVVPYAELKSQSRDLPRNLDFKAALLGAKTPFAVIAEVKRKSPSKGIIREDFDPASIAQDYAQHGAAALSVLTDENFFGGSLGYLSKIRNLVSIPLLRKDFLWEPYQVYEARVAQADAILLIAAMLEKNQILDLMGLAKELGLSVLFEVHTESECATATEVKAEIVGVNNRNLKSFTVDIECSERLFPLLPKAQVKISESGIDHLDTMKKLKHAGADAFLIGESLMKKPSPGLALQNLMSGLEV